MLELHTTQSVEKKVRDLSSSSLINPCVTCRLVILASEISSLNMLYYIVIHEL